MPTGDTPGEFATITAVTPGTIPQTPGGGFPRPGPSRRIPHQQSDAFPSHPHRPPLQRGQSQIQQIAHNTIASSAKFVGIPFAERSPDLSDWDSRRLRFLNKRYKLKEGCVKPPQSYHENVDSVTPTVIDTPSVDARLGTGPPHFLQRSTSQESRPRLEKKDSVLKVAYDTFSSLIKRGTVSRPKPRQAPLGARCSFDLPELDDLPPTLAAPSSTIEPVPEALSEVLEEEEPKYEEPVISSDAEWIELPERPTSFADTRALSNRNRRRMAWGMNSLPIIYDDETGMPMPRPRHCFAQLKVSYGPDDEAEVRDQPPRKSKSWTAPPKLDELEPLKPEGYIEGLQDSQMRTHVDVPYVRPLPPDVGSSDIQGPPAKVRLQPMLIGQSLLPDRITAVHRKLTGPKVSRQPAIDDDADAKQKITAGVLLESIAGAVVPKQKRYRGVGPIGRLFNHHLGKTEVKKLNPELQEMLERGEDHRPFFTYWVTTVQICVCLISIITYGIGPFGVFERVENSKEVVDTSLASRRVSYYEPTNIWVGPRLADLVRLGAKYSPCMRRERDVWKGIEMERQKENDTACCIFNDRTGCYQTTENGCPRALATWVKWSKPRKTLARSKSDSHLLHAFKEADVSTFNTITHHRSAGAVCGQDPDFCTVPRSVHPREWPDDLTRWPICKEPRTEGAFPPHMTCQITGRPCCIQMQGLCRITTKEYCDFVQGYWHSNATLCSQVDCFGDICGMLPFVSKDHPNQFYRLFTSLFIHAGVIHLAITLIVHRFLMIDLEALIGWKRMALVYIGSGIGGNLASAIFVPYNPEVGPSGSQLGILAAMFVDVIHHRRLITNWKHALAVHFATVLILFAFGLVPFIDNWAHIFGFIFGLFITMSIFPYLDFNFEETLTNKSEMPDFKIQLTVRRRTILVIFSCVVGLSLFGVLCFVYFSNLEINCPYCGYLNCVNVLMYDHYCDNKGLELSHWLPI